MRSFIIYFFILLLAVNLIGCTNELASFNAPSYVTFALDSTVPYPNQNEFPITGQIILHFTQDLDPSTVNAAMIKFYKVQNEISTTAVSKDIEVKGPNIILKPFSPLSPASTFEFIVPGEIRAKSGTHIGSDSAGKIVRFYTEEYKQNSLSAPALTYYDPDVKNDDVFDFETFRFYFSEPIDSTSVILGSSFIVKAKGQPVTGNIFVNGHQVVFDPDADLKPGVEHEITLTQGIIDVTGSPLKEEYHFKFTPKDSTPRKKIVVDLCPTLGEGSPICQPTTDPSFLPDNQYTGLSNNSMVVRSMLLGDSMTYISGLLEVEIGNAALYPNRTPVVIRKGQKLYGTPIDAKLGGKISTGLNTGLLAITLLTDAVGYMADNRIFQGSPGKGKPTLVFNLDSSINTVDPITNASMTQEILGVKLVGFSEVDPSNGDLIMEVAGFSDLDLFGERMGVTMSLVMTPIKTTPPKISDTTPPYLTTTSPVPESERVDLYDPVILTFSEPLDPDSVENQFAVLASDGAMVSGKWIYRGAKMVFYPDVPFDPITRYTITIGGDISDINGNHIGSETDFGFVTCSARSTSTPPLIGTSSPGEGDYPNFPAHMPLWVTFTQMMKEETIIYGESLDLLDSTGASVPALLNYHGSYAEIVPDQNLNPGQKYRIKITDDITNLNDVHLDLDRDGLANDQENIHESYIDFIAAEPKGQVPLLLITNPMADTDGSGYLESQNYETQTDTNYFKMALIKEKSYADGYVVGYVKGLNRDASGVPFMDIELIKGTWLYATSVQIGASQINSGDESKGPLSPMGRISIYTNQPGSSPSYASPDNTSAFKEVTMFGELHVQDPWYEDHLVHELKVSADGSLEFSQDGRMVISLTGSSSISLKVPIINITVALPTQIYMRVVTGAQP